MIYDAEFWREYDNSYWAEYNAELPYFDPQRHDEIQTEIIDDLKRRLTESVASESLPTGKDERPEFHFRDATPEQVEKLKAAFARAGNGGVVVLDADCPRFEVVGTKKDERKDVLEIVLQEDNPKVVFPIANPAFGIGQPISIAYTLQLLGKKGATARVATRELLPPYQIGWER